ncbi:MAG: ATP-binding cassette domain-containing protein [Anaerolineae bacterium]|nr:ATP-binding cassette domain-containing protein [Anaerolineae bacterium]
MSLLTESRRALKVSQPEGEIVVRLEGVSVRYRVPQERVGTFKEYAIRALQGRNRYHDFWALRDVNLEVRRSEVLGIIGRNGAGKSTLLKVVARVLRPTEGRVWVKGRVAPLLELQAGFQPELTGRENVYLNGALLGFTARQIRDRFDSIVSFAELWDFIDAPLRTYSSGMLARLGFAIATDAMPDVLIVDEALSVGDEAFRRKSMARINEFREAGATILFVSHSMDVVRQVCTRAVWLEQGRVAALGAAPDVVRAYLPQQGTRTKQELVAPYGERLVSLLVTGAPEREELEREATRLPSLQLSPRSMCDLELLATGAFSPLDRFMNEADYRRVLTEMRLANGTLWPMPITLPVPDESELRPGDRVALRGPGHELLAVMDVEERYRSNLDQESLEVCGTTDERHPLVAEMLRWGGSYISGAIKVLRLPVHTDFAHLRRTPEEVRHLLEGLGRRNVVAFRPWVPIFRPHEELTKRIAAELDATLLICPEIGCNAGDWISARTRVLCCEAVVEHYDPGRVVLTALALAARRVGPREALWHAVVARNYGANHMIVAGYGVAGPTEEEGHFHEPGKAMALVMGYAHEVGITPIPFRELVYVPEEDRYEERSRVAGTTFLSLSVAEAKKYIDKGEALPHWFARPEVARLLRQPQS